MKPIDLRPTPWTYDDNRPGFEGLVAVFDAEGTHLVSFGDMEDCEGRDINEARLHSAAPDLLAACEEVVETFSIFTSPSTATMAKLQAAIAKARGTRAE